MNQVVRLTIKWAEYGAMYEVTKNNSYCRTMHHGVASVTAVQ